MTQRDSAHAAHSRLREQFTGPSLKAMRTLLTRPVPGYGTLLPLVAQTPG